MGTAGLDCKRGGWRTAVFLYNVRQQSAPLSAKSVSFGAGFNNFRSGTKANVRRAARLTFLSADAGASPRTAGLLAAIEVLADRASAPDGSVRGVYPTRFCLVMPLF